MTIFRYDDAKIIATLHETSIKGEMEANGPRFVTCYNACEGIENPVAALEAARLALKEAFDHIDLEIMPDGSCPAAANSTIRAINKALAALGVK
jgi:pyruvate/2-oxoacid:ferredoxin oxidoreductase beta subunit